MARGRQREEQTNETSRRASEEDLKMSCRLLVHRFYERHAHNTLPASECFLLSSNKSGPIVVKITANLRSSMPQSIVHFDVEPVVAYKRPTDCLFLKMYKWKSMDCSWREIVVWMKRFRKNQNDCVEKLVGLFMVRWRRWWTSKKTLLLTRRWPHTWAHNFSLSRRRIATQRSAWEGTFLNMPQTQGFA